MVEPQPSKLVVRVRFSSPALNHRVTGMIAGVSATSSSAQPSPANEWDLYAADWDANDAARAYAQAAFASLQAAASELDVALDGAEVLDFGCGTGLLAEILVTAGCTVWAVDTSPAMLDALNVKITDHGLAHVHTATTLPTGHDLFDLVVCSSVCAFVDDYPSTVVELAALLRGGGMFVQWDWERQATDPHGLTRMEIRNALGEAGLVDVSVHDAFSISVGEESMSPIMGYGLRPFDTAQT